MIWRMSTTALINFIKDILSVPDAWYRVFSLGQKLELIFGNVDKQKVQKEIYEWLKRRMEVT